jgi:hypothetical protein
MRAVEAILQPLFENAQRTMELPNGEMIKIDCGNRS